MKSDTFKEIADTMIGTAKFLLSPRRTSITPHSADEGDTLIIMGNGPSLKQTIANDIDILRRHPLMAVNFAANTPEFQLLKPRYYTLADPHFFQKQSDPNVARLIANINSATWTITLFVPIAARKHTSVFNNPSVTIEYFNATGIEGFPAFRRFMYRIGAGMPRPRNVLIPSLMAGIALGFKRIFITGADHGWTKTLSVNERNEVISIQPHYYTEDKHEQQRIRVDYLNYPLHQILFSFYTAFKSYFIIEDYATKRGVQILNATEGSFIDAFQRQPLRQS